MKKNNNHFDSDMWIKFLFKNKVCVGRTFKDNGMVMVSYTDEDSSQSQVPLCLLTDVVKLSFVKNLSAKPVLLSDSQPGFQTCIVKSERCGSFSVKLGKN